MRRLAMIILLFAVLLSYTSSAPLEGNLPAKFTAKVQLRVSGSDNIKGEALSYLSRELRLLNDIVLVDEGADWILSIIAMEISTTGGYKSGITVSVVVMQPLDNEALAEIFELNSEKIKFFKELTSGFYSFEDHWIHTCGSDQLRATCRKIVADFDGNHLENAKKFQEKSERIREEFQKRRK